MKEKADILRETLSAQEKAIITRDLFERYRRGETSSEENDVIESLEKEFIPEKDFDLTDEFIAELETETKNFVFKNIGIEKAKKRNLRPILIGSAASIALLVIGMLIFHKSDEKQPDIVNKYVAASVIENITLPDGSEVVLNAGTTLNYNNSREVWLHEGEAFFNVKPDSAKPFVVNLRDGVAVRVTGTSFTIQNYSELPFQEVCVLSGKVNVFTQNNQNVELVANQQATYSIQEKELLKASTNSAQKAAWRTGTIVLENASLAELRLRIRQLYGKNIVFENYHEAMSINISFTKEIAFDEIVAEIATLYNLAYRATSDEIIFSPKNIE